MAIRIREVDGHWVAVCAAKAKVQRGDIYLNDNFHHALTTKFAIDHEQPEIADPVLVKLMKKEESMEAMPKLKSQIKPERMGHVEIGPRIGKPIQ